MEEYLNFSHWQLYTAYSGPKSRKKHVLKKKDIYFKDLTKDSFSEDPGPEKSDLYSEDVRVN
jgi:hypothetical protein